MSRIARRRKMVRLHRFVYRHGSRAAIPAFFRAYRRVRRDLSVGARKRRVLHRPPWVPHFGLSVRSRGRL